MSIVLDDTTTGKISADAAEENLSDEESLAYDSKRNEELEALRVRGLDLQKRLLQAIDEVEAKKISNSLPRINSHE